jgi:hypothetical protein
MTVYLRHLSDCYGGIYYAVTFRYDKVLVDTLKDVVPHRHRTWDPDTREWQILDTYVDNFTAEVRKLGIPVITLQPPPPPRRPPPRSNGGGDWARALFHAVGPTRADAVHRALTRVLHPDTATGDTTLQRELNTARDNARVNPT